MAAANDKSILLFIVEGVSDEQSLAPALEKIITKENVKFKVMNEDITTNTHSDSNNIVDRIRDRCINDFIAKNPQYTKTDICGIVHIVDLDGAFIPESNIEEDPLVEKPIYQKDKIICANKSKFLISHTRKKAILETLSQIDSIKISARQSVPYSIFYMSCNLDHVLHNLPNSTVEEKRNNSVAFGDEYDDPIKFEDFFNKDEIKIKGTYDETWKYAAVSLNSLKRGSNFWICIRDNKT